MGYLKMFTENRELQRWETRRLVSNGNGNGTKAKATGCVWFRGGEVIGGGGYSGFNYF